MAEPVSENSGSFREKKRRNPPLAVAIRLRLDRIQAGGDFSGKLQGPAEVATPISAGTNIGAEAEGNFHRVLLFHAFRFVLGRDIAT